MTKNMGDVETNVKKGNTHKHAKCNLTNQTEGYEMLQDDDKILTDEREPEDQERVTVVVRIGVPSDEIIVPVLELICC